MSDKDEIFEYVMNNPENTNPAILREMLGDLDNGSGGGVKEVIITVDGDVCSINASYNDIAGKPVYAVMPLDDESSYRAYWLGTWYLDGSIYHADFYPVVTAEDPLYFYAEDPDENMTTEEPIDPDDPDVPIG